MARQRHLSNAPIVEAVVDLRCQLTTGFDVSRLSVPPKEIASAYPTKEIRKGFGGGIEIDRKLQIKSQVIDRGIVGYDYKSDDKMRVLQFRNDGFTFSKLKPYETWDKLRDEARKAWHAYVKLANPETVMRLALRYINHLKIPFSGEKFDFGDYLTAAPQVPRELPQGISSFLYRLVLPAPSIGAIAIINQAVESVISPKEVPIIVDIDAFVQCEFEASDEKIWETFERLHIFKNDIFFSYITEKTAEIYS